MAFFPPIPLIRKKKILTLLEKSNAFSESTAKKLDEIGLINPYGFKRITNRLVEKGIIKKTSDNRYYIEKNN